MRQTADVTMKHGIIKNRIAWARCNNDHDADAAGAGANDDAAEDNAAYDDDQADAAVVGGNAADDDVAADSEANVIESNATDNNSDS